jgi:beta-glucanase (GH16 family)
VDNWYNVTVTDSHDIFHDYEIRWTPDDITFLVDGEVGKVRKRTDKWNSTSQGWNFPQTPARVELSIWPGGASSNAEGTIEWAGGPVDWDSEQIQEYGYDYAIVDEITISCYRADSGPGYGFGEGKSYTYNDSAGTNASVVVGDKGTILASFEATGTDMNKGNGTSAASGTASGSAVSATGGSSPASGSSSGSDSESESGSSSGTSGNECTSTGFVQTCGSTGTSQSHGVRSVTCAHEWLLAISLSAATFTFLGVMYL